MADVTLRRKRYVSVCLACDGLFDSRRSDQLTCDSACRVHLHRHPELAGDARREAERAKLPVSKLRQAQALLALRPDLAAEVEAGLQTITDVQPEVWSAYQELLQREVDGTPDINEVAC